MIEAFICTACDQAPARAIAKKQPAVEAPRQVLERMIKLRAERKYSELRTVVVAKNAAEVEQTLMAVDEFLDANRRLCDWVRDRVGIGLAQTIDQSDLADNLSIFSRHIELLDESITNEQASVSFTVEGRLPAECARLRRVGGAWRYDPEGGYSPNLPLAFREMARGLDRVRDDLDTGRLVADALRDDPTALVERVKDRLRRGVGLLSKARTEAGPGE